MSDSTQMNFIGVESDTSDWSHWCQILRRRSVALGPSCVVVPQAPRILCEKEVIVELSGDEVYYTA